MGLNTNVLDNFVQSSVISWRRTLQLKGPLYGIKFIDVAEINRHVIKEYYYNISHLKYNNRSSVPN